MLKENASSNLFFANDMEYVFRVSIFMITATGTEILMILITVWTTFHLRIDGTSTYSDIILTDEPTRVRGLKVFSHT